MIYFTVALINDFVSSRGSKQLRDYVIASLALPLALETSLMYWSLRSIDRELVFPKALDAFFPQWLDLMLHTNVTVFILIEAIYVSSIKYPSRKSAIRGLTLFLLGYLIWLYVIKLNTGKWVYSILDFLSGPQRIGFFAASGLVSIALYFVGEFINKITASKESVGARVGAKKTK